MLTKGKDESYNNNKEHEGQDGNVKNTICNRRIEHATTATIDNNDLLPSAPWAFAQKKKSTN